ncbi:MAG TPA: FAD-binding oxidoreductase, partial [Mycobacterium sp.]|nr:FAD-binding oxidoreductase [Mycobacterium sp.]
MFTGLVNALARGTRKPAGRTAAVTIPQAKEPSSRWGKPGTALPRHRVRVVGVERETPDAVTLLLEPLSGEPVAFSAGQYLTHCFEIDGTVVKRAYSISAAEGGQLACTIKAIENGVASRFVFDHVDVGYEYPVIGPSGDFVLPADPTTSLAFLAAGSGITPVMAMIDTALQQNPDRLISLVYASRRQSDIIFADRLEQLERKYAGLAITWVLSRPDDGWSGLTGRLDEEQAARLLQARPDAEIYLCGPEELAAATAGALAADGVAPGRIHRERFYTSARHTTVLPTLPQPIEFRRSNLTVIAQ